MTKVIYFLMGFVLCFVLSHNSFIKPANAGAPVLKDAVVVPITLADVYGICKEARDAAKLCCKILKLLGLYNPYMEFF